VLSRTGRVGGGGGEGGRGEGRGTDLCRFFGGVVCNRNAKYQTKEEINVPSAGSWGREEVRGKAGGTDKRGEGAYPRE